ncbi:MAG TPA: hypothetical protein VIY47_13530 [Ignavibacteriaceae bacterium]
MQRLNNNCDSLMSNGIANNSNPTLGLYLKVEMMSKQLIFIVKGINHARIYILAEIVFEDYNVGFPEKGKWQTKFSQKTANA